MCNFISKTVWMINLHFRNAFIVAYLLLILFISLRQINPISKITVRFINVFIRYMVLSLSFELYLFNPWCFLFFQYRRLIKVYISMRYFKQAQPNSKSNSHDDRHSIRLLTLQRKGNPWNKKYKEQKSYCKKIKKPEALKH